MTDENLILKGGATGLICDATHSMEANPRRIFSAYKCDVENLNPSTHTENGPHSEAGDVMCPEVKQQHLITFLSRRNIYLFFLRSL